MYEWSIDARHTDLPQFIAYYLCLKIKSYTSERELNCSASIVDDVAPCLTIRFYLAISDGYETFVIRFS